MIQLETIERRYLIYAYLNILSCIYITAPLFHFPLFRRHTFATQRASQSIVIAIHTPHTPKPIGSIIPPIT